MRSRRCTLSLMSLGAPRNPILDCVGLFRLGEIYPAAARIHATPLPPFPYVPVPVASSAATE